ncbi:MAG: hypothetical protein ACN6OS_09120, partial [Comamonas testosteroni]|uniref:hypothetical protein n=1 Tax=Comamonas testosteroni TaxID=285 RepID=UPI003D0B0F3D
MKAWLPALACQWLALHETVKVRVPQPSHLPWSCGALIFPYVKPWGKTWLTVRTPKITSHQDNAWAINTGLQLVVNS